MLGNIEGRGKRRCVSRNEEAYISFPAMPKNTCARRVKTLMFVAPLQGNH